MKNKTISVKDLKSILERYEQHGYGDTKVMCGFPTKLGFGVDSIRSIEHIQIDSMFGDEIIYIKLY